MAALLNSTDFWYLGIDDVVNAYIKHNRKDFITYAWLQGVVLCLISPFIIFGNAFVIYAVWKDPFKNLHSWPSNLILQCMAVADLLAGVILAPMQVYWLFSQAVTQTSALSFQIIMSLTAIFVGTSLAHIFLLSIDRLFAVMRPLSYKFVMSRGRISLAISVLWLYFICFGILMSCLQNSIFIVTIIFIVQMFVILQVTFCFYGLIVYRLRRNYREWQERISRGSVRVTHQEQFADAERRLGNLWRLWLASLSSLSHHLWSCFSCYTSVSSVILILGCFLWLQGWKSLSFICILWENLWSIAGVSQSLRKLLNIILKIIVAAALQQKRHIGQPKLSIQLSPQFKVLYVHDLKCNGIPQSSGYP